MGIFYSTANPRKRDSTVLSTENDSSAPSLKKQKLVPPSASIIQSEQPNDATLKPNNESLNDAGEGSFFTYSDDYLALKKKLQRGNEGLKQDVSDENDKRLGSYENLISDLREKCAEKDKQLAEKNNQLAGKENLLVKLRAENREKNVQLQSNRDEIGKLQQACDRKNTQLDENMKLIEKLQTDCVKKDKQTKATLDRLKSLGKNMRTSSMLVDALLKCGLESSKQNQRVEALLYYDNAIELEMMNLKDSKILAELFYNKSVCYGFLKQYQQSLEAANLALQHNPNCKMTLNNRGFAYFNLKQYSNARQDFERALQLDPSYEMARRNLERVQKLINTSTSQ